MNQLLKTDEFYAREALYIYTGIYIYREREREREITISQKHHFCGEQTGSILIGSSQLYFVVCSRIQALQVHRRGINFHLQEKKCSINFHLSIGLKLCIVTVCKQHKNNVCFQKYALWFFYSYINVIFFVCECFVLIMV